MNLSTKDQSFCASIAEREGASSQLPFQHFYTTGEPVKYAITRNVFEGRGAYFNYFPTGGLVEQKLEKLYHESKNKEVQEKRQMEELKRSVQSWSVAKERMEVEIARKKEAYRRGTDFKGARGFVRRNWKTKNYNPEENPLGELESTDEEDYGQEAESPQNENPEESEKKSE